MKHHNVARFGVSIDEDILKKFDEMLTRLAYPSRSEAIKDLILEKISQEACKDDDQEGFLALSIVYDHHKRELSKKITETQHQKHDHIISTLHVHLDYQNCLEIIILKGRLQKIKRLAAEVIGMKGVILGRVLSIGVT